MMIIIKMTGKNLVLITAAIVCSTVMGVFESSEMRAQFRRYGKKGKDFEDTDLFANFGRGNLGKNGLYLTAEELESLFDEMID